METARLRLREYTWEDFDALYAILSDPETMRYYAKPYDENGTRRWISWSLDNYERYGFGLWAADLKETGELIGDCGLTMQNIDGEELPEIGYHIRKDRWRQGLAKEAARTVRDWAFEHLEFDALYSYMNHENLPSRRTAQSNGMHLLKSFKDSHGMYYDVYTIRREEWEHLKA